MTEFAAKIAALADDVAAIRGEHADRISQLEKRAAREREPSASVVESIGQRLVESEAFKTLNGGRARATAHVEMAAITSANTTVGAGRSQGTSLVQADRRAGIITPPERVLTVRDLIAPGTTGSNSIEYVKETGYTNNAAPVAEGASKPYSDITFDLVSSPVRTIPHLFKISKQMLDDVAGVVSMIDVRGTQGLKLREEEQLLNGSGSGQNLHGLIPQASEFNSALRKVGDTRIDTLRHAILQVRRAEYRATGILMNPDDLEAMELTKDAGGNYVIVDPIEGGQGRIWRLPIVDTMAMVPGEFMVGAFGVAAQVFDRQQATIEISTENADDFEKNMATVRIEERLALAVYRPESFVHGTFEE
ncbi:phage major capsid protein [Xanthobacteraceae bacterium A53D]